MPSKTKKQAAAMRAAAHDPKTAKAMGIPQGLAREFMREDMKRGKTKKR